MITGCTDFKRGFDDGAAAARPAGASNELAPVQPTPVKTTARPATATPEATFRAKVGTAVTYSDGLKIAVLKWEEQAAGRFITPKPGTRLVAVIVRYDNGTPKEVNFNPFDWTLQDSTGVRHQTEFVGGDRNDTLHSGSLAPGSFVTGSVQFAVPIGDVKLEMLYTGFTYKIATWELY